MQGEFKEFLKQYGVIGLAIAVIIGGKLNTLVTAFVDGILMPIVTFFIHGGAWRTATLNVGSVRFLLGPVFDAGMDFLIVAWLVFWFSKKVMKEATVGKKWGRSRNFARPESFSAPKGQGSAARP